MPLVAISGGVVVFALLVYGGLRLGLSSSVSSLVEEIEAASPTASSPTPPAKP